MSNWQRFIVCITIFSVFHMVPLPRIMWLCENFGLQLRKIYVWPLWVWKRPEKKKKTHIWLKKLDLAVWVYLSLLSQHVKP